MLVDDPADIATMLVRLTDDDLSGPDARQTALERKYSDVTRLFSALDPRLAQVMFGKLARAVLNLAPDRRNNLLQRTILPGLLDGDANGKVLRDFPDMDLAESICLLLDLETAAPEVLSAALNRLDLTTDRRAALVPLIEERMRTGRRGAPSDVSLGSSGVERHARELIRIDATRETDFSEFAAFDLSMDAEAETGGVGRASGHRGDRRADGPVAVRDAARPHRAESRPRRGLPPSRAGTARQARARGTMARSDRCGRGIRPPRRGTAVSPA